MPTYSGNIRIALDFNFLLMRFIIISTGYNCWKNAGECIKSVENQTYENFKAIFISDGSQDSTGLFLDGQRSKSILDNRLQFESYQHNFGAAYRRYNAIKKYATDPEDVILLLGLDDEITPYCLMKIKEQYDAGAMCTYGNWIDQFGETLPEGFIDFDEETHQSRNYRKVRYRSTAPNTFKRFLFDQLTEDDFKFKGEWIKATTESNLMISCLEMSGKDRIGVIHEPIYLYNKGRKDNARNRFGNHYQDSIYNDVKNKPKRALYESSTIKL